MPAISTRAKLAGVASALKLKVPSIELFVSDHYPLHSTPVQQARIEKSDHFEATCDILDCCAAAAECALPTHSGTSKTQLGNLHQFIPWIVASRTDAGQIPDGTFGLAVFTF